MYYEQGHRKDNLHRNQVAYGQCLGFYNKLLREMYTFTDTYAEERNGQPKLGLEQLKAGTSFRRFLIGYLQTVNNLQFAL